MNTAIYEGTVTHARLTPRSHRFKYRVFYMLFDLDEVDEVASQVRWFSHNRFNIFSLHDDDHGGDDGGDLRTWIAGVLTEHGFGFALGNVQLLAFPRVLGYVFNPISVWYCHDESGALRAVLHEVRNTFGDKHCYLSAVEADDMTQRFDKKMHVSPFMDMNKTYNFSLTEPAETVSVRIRESDESGEVFRAAFTGSRTAVSGGSIGRLFFRYPLVTFKAVAAIHWEAVRLWLKRVPFVRRPAAPTSPVTTVTKVSS